MMIAAGALALAGAARAADTPAYKVVGQISMPDGGWDYTFFDASGRKAYTARGPVIQGLAVDTLEVTPKAAAAAGSHSAVPLPGDRLLITNGGNNTVTIVNAKDGSQLASIPTGRGPDGAIYDPSSKLVFVADHAGGEVVFVDPKTQAAVGQVMVGGTLEFPAADGKGHVFVNIEDKGAVAEIDIKSKAVLATWTIDGCKSPSGLAYVPGTAILVAACGNQVAAVVDAVSGKTLQTLPIGSGPDAVMFDPTRKLAFVPSGSGQLDVISVAAKDKVAVVQTVQTGPGVRSGTVDPKTGRIYLPSASYPPTPPGQRRGAMIPGTAAMLVVAP
jgi:YVTN family beta-propeller protein